MQNFSFHEVAKSFITALALCAATTFAQAAKPALDIDVPNLVQAISAAAPTNENGIIRSRPIALDFSALKKIRATITTNKPQTIRIGFFDDAALNVQITRTESVGKRGTAYIGTVPGSAFSSAIIVEENGVVSGNINMLDKKYQIRSTADGGHVAREIDAKAFPPDHPADVVRQAHHERIQQTPLRPKPVEGLKQRSLSAKASAPPEAAIRTADNGSLIDVMVVYTPSARISEGGTAGMLSRINLVVAETNAAYANSNVVQRIRLVYAGEVNYVETGLSPDLTRLQNPGDNFMEEVHALRNLYGADLVSLWGNYTIFGNGCGESNIMFTEAATFDTAAFTVVDRNCAGSNLSFAHELGHNMGLLHDNDTDTRTTVTRETTGAIETINYARGYTDATNLFRTVMAVTTDCPTCVRIPYFSNPSVPYNGAPTGNGTADARQALNDTRDTTANFRPSVDFNVPGTLVFSPEIYTVAENASTVALSVTRHTGTVGTVSVNYMTANGTVNPIASAGIDYTTTSGTLNWADGESGAKTFTIPILQNNASTSSPSFTVVLSGQTVGAVISSLGGSLDATVTINNFLITGPAVFQSLPPPNGFLHIPYSYTVVASGAPTIGYALSVPESLPAGLTLDIVTGKISGIPSAVGTASNTIRAFSTSQPPPVQQLFNITITALPPSAPTITSAIAGDAQASITFTPSASRGSALITDTLTYAATCNPGAHTSTGISSLIIVSGLSNGTTYTCGVKATTVHGSTDSATLLVTPIANAPLALVAVKSSKIHGAAGAQFLTIDANAPIAGAISIEPRGSGSTGHTIVFYFNGPVSSIGIVTAKDASGTDVGTASASRVGNTVEVNLLGVPDNKRVTISIPGVNGNITPFTASLGFLVGDLNNNGAVNASDISAVKTHANQTTNETNAKFDVNASGTIDAADVSAVKARSGLVLPTT